MRRSSAVASVITALALVVTPAPPSGAAAAAEPAVAAVTYRVLTWNVAGWTMHRGSTTNGMPTVVANAVRNADVDFFALNELCFGQLHAVQDVLRARRWMSDPTNFSRFEPTNNGADGSCNGSQSGIAIFSRTPFGDASRFTLPDDGRVEQRKLICAPPANRPTVKFCTTHITHLNMGDNGVPKVNVLQLNYVRDRLEEFEAAGHTVIIAGDFNAQPNYPRVDAWYSSSLNHPNNSNNSGHYRELDDTDSRCPGYGETTSPKDNKEGPCETGKKLNLIFVRENKIAGGYDADSVEISNECGGPCSDHRHLWGSVTVLA